MKVDEKKYMEKVSNNLARAKATLEYSYGICAQFGMKNSYTEEEKDRFESLCSKFARLLDLILKQAFKLISIIDLEEPPATVRDAINLAEKKGLVSDALLFVEIRRMRNKIAHEYVDSDELLDMYRFMLKHTPDLFDSVERIDGYCKKLISQNQ